MLALALVLLSFATAQAGPALGSTLDAPPQASELQAPGCEVHVQFPDGSDADKACVYVTPSSGVLVPSMPRPGEIRRVTCSASGRAKIRLPDATRPAYVWAVTRRKGVRYATRVHAIPAPARDLRIELIEFPVSKIRVVGLDAWRRLLPQSRHFECVFVHRKYPHPSFRVTIPSEVNPVLPLPPLPSGVYDVHVVDEAGHIDAVTFVPYFFDRVDREHVYERDVPLKRVLLGAPTLVRLRLESAALEGRSLAGVPASVQVFSKQALVALSRRVAVDERGAVELLLPDLVDRQGSAGIGLRVFARGFAPAKKTFSCKRDMPRDDVLALEPVDFGSSLAPPRSTKADALWVSMQLPDESSATVLRLNAVERSLLAPLKTGWRGFFVERRGGRLWPVAGEIRQGDALRRGEQLRESVFVLRDGERLLPGAHVELCVLDGGKAVASVPLRADARAEVNVRLPEGLHYVLAAHEQAGASFTPVLVRDGGRHEIELQPFATYHGSVRCRDGERAGGAVIKLVPDLRSVPTEILRCMLDVIPQPAHCDARGRYRLRLPSFVPRWQLQFRKELYGRECRAAGLLEPQFAYRARDFVIDD